GALRRVDFAQADPDLLVILQHGERIAIGDAGSAAGRVAAKLRVAVNTLTRILDGSLGRQLADREVSSSQ
ncbi:hypothetical protein, partial [Immundisolibacter sp.]|uniref:hypothetical protein n=1 Tax=Immundisolibacter sp. TaxID=1934948 RepID=UPI0035622E47